MKRTAADAIIAAMVAATPAYAGTGEEAGLGLLGTAFIGFAAVIVVFQLFPALMLFFGMVKGIFGADSKPAVMEVGPKDGKL